MKQAKHLIERIEAFKHMRGRHDQRTHNRWPSGYIAQDITPTDPTSRRSAAVLQRNSSSGSLILENKNQIRKDRVNSRISADTPESSFANPVNVGGAGTIVQFEGPNGEIYFDRKNPFFFRPAHGDPRIWTTFPTYMMPIIADDISTALGVNVFPAAQLMDTGTVVTSLVDGFQTEHTVQSDAAKNGLDANLYTINDIKISSENDYVERERIFEATAIMEWLIGQSDGHGGNYGFVPVKDKDGNIVSYQLHSYDTDLAGAKASETRGIAGYRILEMRLGYGNLRPDGETGLFSPRGLEMLKTLRNFNDWRDEVPDSFRKQFKSRVDALIKAHENISLNGVSPAKMVEKYKEISQLLDDATIIPEISNDNQNKHYQIIADSIVYSRQIFKAFKMLNQYLNDAMSDTSMPNEWRIFAQSMKQMIEEISQVTDDISFTERKQVAYDAQYVANKKISETDDEYEMNDAIEEFTKEVNSSIGEPFFENNGAERLYDFLKTVSQVAMFNGSLFGNRKALEKTISDLQAQEDFLTQSNQPVPAQVGRRIDNLKSLVALGELMNYVSSNMGNLNDNEKERFVSRLISMISYGMRIGYNDIKIDEQKWNSFFSHIYKFPSVKTKSYKHMRGRHDQRTHNRWPSGYVAQSYRPVDNSRRTQAFAVNNLGSSGEGLILANKITDIPTSLVQTNHGSISDSEINTPYGSFTRLLSHLSGGMTKAQQKNFLPRNIPTSKINIDRNSRSILESQFGIDVRTPFGRYLLNALAMRPPSEDDSYSSFEVSENGQNELLLDGMGGEFNDSLIRLISHPEYIEVGIESLSVHEEYRKQGIGLHLTMQLLDSLRMISAVTGKRAVITLHAAGNVDNSSGYQLNGALTWPKFGFAIRNGDRFPSLNPAFLAKYLESKGFPPDVVNKALNGNFTLYDFMTAVSQDKSIGNRYGVEMWSEVARDLHIKELDMIFLATSPNFSGTKLFELYAKLKKSKNQTKTKGEYLDNAGDDEDILKHMLPAWIALSKEEMI